ncbi:hypothetical protein [Agromyces allii]|nr:hypothetical protein [Agromyces allii]
MSGAQPYAPGDPDTSTPAATERPAFELRPRLVETAVIVASVVVLRAVGLLLIVLSSSGLNSFDVLPRLVVMVVDWNLLVWVALAAAVQLGLREMRRPGRWALILAAVPVAVLIATAVRSLPGSLGLGFVGVLGNGIAWLDAGILTVVVALGLAFTAAALGRERRTSARIAGVLLALGGLLTLVLLWQAFETYFALFGSTPDVTDADANRYVVTASITLGVLVGAIVFAAISRRRGLIITACIAACLGLIVAVAVPVPYDRFAPAPELVPVDPGGVNGCMGEGDPNCVGG